ncbi:MAG TPA: metalloregulator ArsR/SmtB family transcription factor [Alphaproteobacteria bacterium]|nr:metalloregulator ArsR/SmtB family transcription factor [Alphaproteobacteria bacterium]
MTTLPTPAACCGPTETDELADAELAVLCKALGHPARLRLLRYLAAQGSCVFGDLSAILDLAPSTVSQHLTILKEAGLVCGSGERGTGYCTNPDRLARLSRLITGLCG